VNLLGLGRRLQLRPLISAAMRSAEDKVTGDWAAVAAAINARMAELGRSQQNLIDLSGLAKATIGELRKNKEGREHSARTLKDMSVALDWHPGHLLAVLQGRTPPQLGSDIPKRLDVIERRLDQIFDRLDKVDALDGRFDGLVADIETAVRRVMFSRERQGH
jgi:hypothetical protein